MPSEPSNTVGPTGQNVCALILAGGLGTRLRGVLPDLPKPMAPVAGKPFVEWVARFLAGQGVTQAVLSTGYKAAAFDHHFSQTRIPGIAVRCVAEPEPMGTAGGFLHAAQSCAEPPAAWLVLNGDSLIVTDLQPFLATLDDPAVDAAVLALWMDDASRYGSLAIGPDGRLESFMEKRPGSSWINSGVYLLRHELLGRFPARRPLSWETDVFPALLDSGARILAHRVQGAFLDIGLPETLSQADQFIRQNAEAFRAFP